MQELAIDASSFSMATLLDCLMRDWRHGSNWRRRAVIIREYMPPCPSADTLPKCVVKLGGSFLRHSAGPSQGHFWDLYGDDYHSPEMALLALIESEPPPWLLKRDGASKGPAPR